MTVMFDVRTKAVLGDEVCRAIKQGTHHHLQKYLVSDRQCHRNDSLSPVCDDVTKEQIMRTLPESDLIIAVGSGVINDLAKWVAFEKKIPYLVFATAASMNGYASANVAAQVNGLKVLFKARAPEYVFALPSVLESAPAELTTAGLGDALAKPVSSADWKLNELLFGEYFCQYAVDIVAEQEKIYVNNPQGIRDRDPQAIRALFFALCYSGVSMSIAGSSSPASGGEHLLSHTLDMLAHRDGGKHDLHGRQVGVGTILSATLYEKVLSLDVVDWRPLEEFHNEVFWTSLSDEVRGQYATKLLKAKEALVQLQSPQRWAQIKQELKKYVRAPHVIKECLRQAGAAHKSEHIGVRDIDEFVRIWSVSHEMRSRFTILDLARLAGVMPELARELVHQWVL